MLLSTQLIISGSATHPQSPRFPSSQHTSRLTFEQVLLWESEKRGVGSLFHYLFVSPHFSQGSEHQLVSWRELISSGPNINLPSLQMGFMSCFNLAKSAYRTQCTEMTTKQDVPLCTTQATEAGALEEKDTNFLPSVMLLNGR